MFCTVFCAIRLSAVGWFIGARVRGVRTESAIIIHCIRVSVSEWRLISHSIKPMHFVYLLRLNECIARSLAPAITTPRQSNPIHLLRLNALRVRNLQSLEAALSRDFLLQQHHALLIARRIRRLAFEFPAKEVVVQLGSKLWSRTPRRLPYLMTSS